MTNKIAPKTYYHYAGARYDIVRVSPGRVHVVKAIGGTCKTWSENDFSRFIADRHIELRSNGEETHQIPDSDLAEEELKLRNFRYDLVTEVLAQCPNYSARNDPRLKRVIALVAERHNRKPPSIPTLARWTKDFNDHNQNKNILLPKFKAQRSRFPHEIELIIEDEIEKAYLSERPYNQSYLAAEIYIAVKKFLDNHPVYGDDELPSLRTFRRRVQSANPLHTNINKNGKEKGKRAMRAAGRSVQVRRALEYVEFDGNYIDCILIDESTGEVIGRAYLTLGIDVYTRCIVAYEISYQPFSSSTLLRALRQAYNEENGLPGGKIEMLRFDNGSDYISDTVKNLISFTGSSLAMAPPEEPNFKAHVETMFRALNYQLIHQLPGTTFSNPQEREGYDSEKMAFLPIEALRSHIRDYIDTYHLKIHDGMQRAPLSMWNTYLNRYAHFTFDSSELDVQARKVIQLSISKGRVRHLGLQWFSHPLRYLEEMLKQRNMPTKVSVYIDETDISSVHVRDPLSDHQVIKAEIVDPWRIEGLSYDEYKAIRKKLMAENRDSEYLSKEQALILRAEHLREIWEDYHHKKKRRKVAIKTDGNRARLKERIDEYETEIDSIQQERSLSQLRELESLPVNDDETFEVIG